MQELTPVELVGIAMTVYKPSLNWLEKQLESITTQTYTNWTCVITVDSDLSEIRSAPLLKRFFEDGRFVWHQNTERLGHKANFFQCLSLLRELNPRWIFMCDQDDLWMPEKIALQVSELRKLPPYSVCHCDLYVIQGETYLRESVWQRESRKVSNLSPLDLIVQNQVTGTSAAMDARLLEKLWPVSPDVDYHDHWIAIVASLCGEVQALKKPLVWYRQHTGNVIGSDVASAVLAFPKGSKAQVLQRLTDGYFKTERLASFLMDRNLIRSKREMSTILSKFDFGMKALLLGLKYFASSRRLARSYFRFAAGKFLAQTLTGHSRSN